MLLPNVQNVIARHATSMSMNRLGALQASNGFRNRSAGTTATIRGVIQPATPKMLERLPEGQRAGAWYMVWRVGGDLLNGDVITWNSKTYQVEHTLDWVEAGNFASALAKQSTPDSV